MEFHPLDIGRFVDQRSVMTDDQRYQLHTSPMFFQGTMKVANQELFNINGLSKYNWLVYSEDKSGGFCLPCVLFAKHSCDLGQLVMHILSTFTSASNRLREHETKVYQH